MGRVNLDSRAVEVVGRDARRTALGEAQEDVAFAALETVGRDTEYLADNIKVMRLDAEAREGEVVADTEYALHHHEPGKTRKWKGNPYFSQAIDRVKARKGL